MARRGFALLPPEERAEIARLGGLAAHAKGVGHEFTPEEAKEAGRRGGQRTSADRAHMAEIGRRGGLARWNGTAAPIALLDEGSSDEE